MSEYSVEEVRARFESAFARKEGLNLFRLDGEYSSTPTRWAFAAYQAAYANLLERTKADEGMVPFGYAYRYADGIKVGGDGRERNGMRPTEAIPLFAHPQAQAAQVEDDDDCRGPIAGRVGMSNIDAILRAEALAYIAEHAIVAVGDIVTTTWGGWKKPQKVRINSVTAHLVCRFDDGLGDWVAGYSMAYCAERIKKDGTSKERGGCTGICLLNLQTDDGKCWAPGGRWNEAFGFNHAGLSWGDRRDRRRNGGNRAGESA